MKLSIIVPVYNVEQFIRPCILSIYRQSLQEKDFEVILVNDGTQDNSFEKISDIIDEHNNIIIVEQSNQGLSAARNTGLSRASGQYILFLDSDDLLIIDTLSPLLTLINENTIDLLIAGFVKLNSEAIESFNNNCSSGLVVEKKTASEIFLHDFNPRQCYVWRTIYRKAFLNNHNIRFIPGIYFEDVPFTTECLLKATNCIKTDFTFYIYRQRENSIVSSINLKKIIDFNTVIAKLWDIYVKESHSIEIQKQLMNTLFTTFSISVWYVSHNHLLFSQRKTVLTDLNQKVPHLRFTNGYKQRMTSLVFRVAPSFYIWLHSFK